MMSEQSETVVEPEPEPEEPEPEPEPEPEEPEEEPESKSELERYLETEVGQKWLAEEGDRNKAAEEQAKPKE